MIRKTRLRWLLLAAFATNTIVFLDILTVGKLVPHTIAEEGATAGDSSGDEAEFASGEEARILSVDGTRKEFFDATEVGLKEAMETYRNLLEEVTGQKEALDRKAAELVERERQIQMVRAELDKEHERVQKVRDEVRKERENLAVMRSPSFDKLLKAYEGMEPDNAAIALSELHGKDRLVVVDLLLGLKPRQSAAALDALAALAPRIAADVSYEIWKRDPQRKRRDP